MTTALELRREGWKPYVEAARRRPPPPGLAPLEQHAREQLLARTRAAAEVLKTRFGVRHVILFGSLAHGAWFTPDADVDLAVEGLQSQDYWDAWRVAEELIGQRSVDLIEYETAGASLQRAIQRSGMEL